MLARRIVAILAMALTMMAIMPACTAFLPRPLSLSSSATATTSVTKSQNAPPMALCLAKKPKKDYSFIETRDMTREEMLEYNRRSEEAMQTELGAMTAFSLIISLPLLYLCWVAFFSE